MTYQHQNTQTTLFYAKGTYQSNSGGIWRAFWWSIGQTNGFTAQNPILYGRVESVVLCPEQITETKWSEYYYGWNPSYIQIQCHSSGASGIPEFEPDADISDLNDTNSSLLNYTLAYDMQVNELKIIFALEIFLTIMVWQIFSSLSRAMMQVFFHTQVQRKLN